MSVIAAISSKYMDLRLSGCWTVGERKRPWFCTLSCSFQERRSITADVLVIFWLYQSGNPSTVILPALKSHPIKSLHLIKELSHFLSPMFSEHRRCVCVGYFSSARLFFAFFISVILCKWKTHSTFYFQFV